VDLSIPLTTCFLFPWILLTNLHRRLNKYSYMLPLNTPHCIFVFSHSMFCLIVPLLARRLLPHGSLHSTSIRVIGVNYSLSHNEPGPPNIITEPRNESITHLCHQASLLVSSARSAWVVPDRDLQNHLVKECQLQSVVYSYLFSNFVFEIHRCIEP